MRINTNVNAMIANNKMAQNTALAGKSMEKLSTGLRINRAGDDAAGLAISEKMRSQIRGMEQADRNVQDGISLVQTAEGALGEAQNIVNRMRELGVQAGNETLNEDDVAKIETELNALGEELLNISAETKFNGKRLLDDGETIEIQAGANNEGRSVAKVDLKTIAEQLTGGSVEFDGDEALDDIENANHETVTITAGSIDVSGKEAANTFIAQCDAALGQISTGRAQLGATQNRLEATSSNLTTSTENLTSAESRIRDVDVAKEMVNLSKLNIINQAAQAMAAQAKQQPQGVIQLLQ